MSDNLSGLIASADRRRRAAVLLFASAIGLAAVFPKNDRAMWVPEAETPFVFTAVPEKLPVTYLTIAGADTLLRDLSSFPGNDTGRRLRSRLLPPGSPVVATPPGAENVPDATVPEFNELPTQLAQAQSTPGVLNTGPGGIPGIVGGGPGTLNDPDSPTDEPPVNDPPVDDPPIVSPVPEPMTWALLIFGFGMIGSALRRRKTATAV